MEFLQSYVKPRPLLVVLSGPLGVGKDATLTRMKVLRRPYHFTVTATTRQRRPYEQDGVDYIFLSKEQFQHNVAHGEFLEWAQVYGHFYGVPKGQIRDALASGKTVIVKVDVQGAATIKKIVPDAVFIFLAPPDMATLEQRLRLRKTEAKEDLATRLRTVEEEVRQLPLFDYLVVNYNDRLDEAEERIAGIILAEEGRIPPRAISL